MTENHILLLELESWLKQIGRVEKEYRFHPVRKWRFDYALPDHMIAIEIEGGIWMRGRHVRGKGYLSDIDKYNSATVLGWRVLRYSYDHLRKQAYVTDISSLVKEE